jgi:hypothetical protein
MSAESPSYRKIDVNGGITKGRGQAGSEPTRHRLAILDLETVLARRAIFLAKSIRRGSAQSYSVDRSRYA